MVGLGETRRGGAGCCAICAPPDVDVATIGQYLQPTRRNLPVAEYIDAASSSSLSRLRPVHRLQDGVQRPAGAQLLHGGPGERRGAAASNLKYLGALLTAVLLILAFPRFNLVWLAPVALTPLLVAVAREPRPWRRFSWVTSRARLLVRRVLLDSGRAAYYGGLAGAGVAHVSAVLPLKALHMGVFALLAGILMRRWWAMPAVAALWVAIEGTHGSLGFAWLELGNAGIDMGLPMRLAPYTGVYGLSFVFMMMATALALAVLGGRACI